MTKTLYNIPGYVKPTFSTSVYNIWTGSNTISDIPYITSINDFLNNFDIGAYETEILDYDDNVVTEGNLLYNNDNPYRLKITNPYTDVSTTYWIMPNWSYYSTPDNLDVNQWTVNDFTADGVSFQVYGNGELEFKAGGTGGGSSWTAYVYNNQFSNQLYPTADSGSFKVTFTYINDAEGGISNTNNTIGLGGLSYPLDFDTDIVSMSLNFYNISSSLQTNFYMNATNHGYSWPTGYLSLRIRDLKIQKYLNYIPGEEASVSTW